MKFKLVKDGGSNKKTCLRIHLVCRHKSGIRRWILQLLHYLLLHLLLLLYLLLMNLLLLELMLLLS